MSHRVVIVLVFVTAMGRLDLDSHACCSFAEHRGWMSRGLAADPAGLSTAVGLTRA
jgi:hypothetical protein